MKNQIKRTVRGLSEESELYYKEVGVYNSFSKSEDSENKIVEFLLPRVKGKVVVDLCCGNGKYASLLEPYVKKYIGIDKSVAQLKTAESKIVSDNINFINSSAEKIPLEDSSVDVIISTWGVGTIHGEYRKKLALKEAERILKSNGSIYLIENDVDSEFQEIRGSSYYDKAREYNEWLVKEGFTRVNTIRTRFSFSSIKEAKRVFSFIWGSQISSNIKNQEILHNIVVFKREKGEREKNILEKVRKSAAYVVRKAQDVHIDPTALTRFANHLSNLPLNNWLEEAPYDLDTLLPQQRLSLLILFDSTSFSYWGTPKWGIEYKDKKYDGSWALLLSFVRAYEEGKPIFNFEYLSDLSLEEWKEITRGNTEIPLLRERLDNLREIGKVISQRYRGNILNLIKKANYDAIQILNLLSSEFSCFTDVSEYEGKTIYFFKRAQALDGDICRWFKNNNSEKIRNSFFLTALADYKLPQILREEGILEYSPILAKKIDNKEELAKDSKEEIEIRASTILAVDLLLEQLKKSISTITSTDINDYLWLESQYKNRKRRPYHLVRTAAY